jgi:hypothetical protein
MSATPEGVLPAESVDAALTWFRAACMKEGASPGDTVYHQSSREMRAVVDAAIAAHVAARVGEARLNALAEAAGEVRLLMLDRDTDIPKSQFHTFKRAQDAILTLWEKSGGRTNG